MKFIYIHDFQELGSVRIRYANFHLAICGKLGSSLVTPIYF